MRAASTDRFLNLLEYFFYLIRDDGDIVAYNESARQLDEKISARPSKLECLFAVDDFTHLRELAASGEKKAVSVELKDGGTKIMRWQFFATKQGILTMSADWEPIQELLQSVRHENLIFKELLLNILPGHVADELISKKSVRPKVYRHSTIMFTDVVSFSRLSFHIDPVSLIRKLNAYFSLHDRIMDEYGIEKIKTIGDSYMSVSGIPAKKRSHAVDCCLAALALLQAIEQMREEPEMVDHLDLNNWSFRIGIHAGPCISGVVGLHKYIFDIWGDSVNIAARMQETGAPKAVSVSEATINEVSPFFDYTYRGEQQIKDIGIVPTYFLDRLKPEFAHDEVGRIPNSRFIERYCDTFGLSDESATDSALPRMIRDYLAGQQQRVGDATDRGQHGSSAE